MSRHRHLAEIKQLEQLLINAIAEMEREYPDDPYRRLDIYQEQEIERLKAELTLHKKIHPILVFNLLINNKNFICMPQITTLTLGSTAPVTLNMTVVDKTSGNVIAGVLSGLSYIPGDPTQDIAVPDPSNPLEVDIHAVSLQGGTSIVGSGNFVSTAMQSDGVTPLFSGTVTGTLVIVNNIVVAVLNPVLAFNQ